MYNCFSTFISKETCCCISEFSNHAQSEVRILLPGDYNTRLQYSVLLLKSYCLSSLRHYRYFHLLYQICHVYKLCRPASLNPNLVLRMIGKVVYLEIRRLCKASTWKIILAQFFYSMIQLFLIPDYALSQ